MIHVANLIFVFMLGACIGSFLNVVVYRVPRVEIPADAGPIRSFLADFKALSDPPSHCPQCNERLRWYDNIPIFGWLKLGGKCRFCKKPISMRYPIVELITALLFVGYYAAYYVWQIRACCPQPRVLSVTVDVLGFVHQVSHTQWIWGDSWPIYFLYMALISGLLAASLIDYELFIIPIQIPWVLAIFGFVVHAIVDRPTIPGALNLVDDQTGPLLGALSAGAAIGLGITIILWAVRIIPTAFPDGEPMLEVDRESYDRERKAAKRAGEPWVDAALPPVMGSRQIRLEISKEMLFLLPAMILGGGCVAATTWMPAIHDNWRHFILGTTWLNGLLGSLLGAMVGGFVVWIVRILGTLGFGRVAMGLGDVHLMFGVGAIIGAGGATIAFFIAPFFAILTTIYRLVFRKGREIPLGPYLSMATAAVMLSYCWIAERYAPGFQGLLIMLSDQLHPR